MYSFFLANVIMFFQAIINHFLLKSYYKFHSFRVRNLLVSFLYLIIWYDFAAWSMLFLILLSRDTERWIQVQSVSICHLNLNSISAYNFTKISLLTAYVSVHNFDIICLSETYVNSKTTTDDKNLQIPDYYLLLADHPSNNKKRCLYLLHEHSSFGSFKYFIS